MSVRYFEFVGEDPRRHTDSSKFWEITVSGSTVTVRYGPIGAAKGQSKEYAYATAEDAEREADSLIAAKVKKGYVEKTS